MSAPRMSEKEFADLEETAEVYGDPTVEKAVAELRRARESEEAALDVLRQIDATADSQLAEHIQRRRHIIRDLLQKADRR